MKVMKNDPEMLEEYDFSSGVRGKYAAKFQEGTNIVILEPELVEYFPDSASVNEALKSLAKIMKKYEEKRVKQIGGDA